MRKPVFLLLTIALSLFAVAQEDHAHPRITQGPVVEKVTSNTGVVAWSTNVSAGTVVHYGTSPDKLSKRSEMPWGGYTHRVTLRDLQPNTSYFYQVSSPDAKGSGEVLKSDIGEFHTEQPKTAVGTSAESRRE
jgi:phosphodiesterase/alkaline phosphatase D-like protein